MSHQALSPQVINLLKVTQFSVIGNIFKPKSFGVYTISLFICLCVFIFICYNLHKGLPVFSAHWKLISPTTTTLPYTHTHTQKHSNPLKSPFTGTGFRNKRGWGKELKYTKAINFVESFGLLRNLFVCLWILGYVSNRKKSPNVVLIW